MSNDEATLWSQTLYDSLFLTLKRGKGGERGVMLAMAELKAKQIPLEEVYNQVRRELGPDAVTRLKRIISTGGKKPPEKKKGGLFSFIKNLFK